MRKKKSKIKDLKYIISGEFDKVHKSLAVELVDAGFLYYSKLTPENYYFWHYEVDDKDQINKNDYTFDWLDITLGPKFNYIKMLIHLYNDDENATTLLTDILNLISAERDSHTAGTATLFCNVFDSIFGRRIGKYQANQTLF